MAGELSTDLLGGNGGTLLPDNRASRSRHSAVVVDDEKVINNDGLRYKDEFVRHKLLDCIGDLALLGGRLLGRITVYKGGHSLHAQFVKKIFEIIENHEEDGNVLV